MGVIVTGPGESVDFALRYFAPSCGIEEDLITGSIHCTLVPYWADRLGKKEFHARQVSARSGDLFCELLGRRIGSDTACPAPEPIGRRACTKEPFSILKEVPLVLLCEVHVWKHWMLMPMD